MPHSPAAVATVDLDDVESAVHVRALEAVPPPVPTPAPEHDLGSTRVPEDPAPQGCVTVTLNGSRACVVRVRGPVDREGIARVDAVLDAVAPMPRPIVVDLSAARTEDRRLWRVLADLVARRRDAGRSVVLEGVHPDVVPDLEVASLPETFLVFQAVCARPA